MALVAGGLLALVGDVLIDRDDPSEVFRDVREPLRAADVLFANLECAYSDQPDPAVGIGELWGLSAPVYNLDAYADAGFSVMALANNHIVDAGYEAMLDTKRRLHELGISTCGAGRYLDEAREPAIVKCLDTRVAFLAYASFFPIGYEARSDTPGLAPFRAFDLWRAPLSRFHIPGVPPVSVSVPDPTDVRHLTEDIDRARQLADIVVVSFHWGDHSRPFHVTEHERKTARYCIDNGASLVIGHHHHTLRGIEWYRDSPILYGLGHFVFDYRLHLTSDRLSELLRGVDGDESGYLDKRPYVTAPREGWPLLPMHEDARMTMVGWATVEPSGIQDVGFLPCEITADGLVHPLRLGTARSDEVINYLRSCNETQRLNGRFTSDDALELAGFETMRVVSLNAP